VHGKDDATSKGTTEAAGLRRRQLLASLLAAAVGVPREARAAPRPLEVRRQRYPAARGISGLTSLAIPTHLRSDERVPLLVLLHGLGETGDAELGARAWVDRYGLVTAYARLLRPPVSRTSTRRDLPDARIAELRDELEKAPFRGLVLACPHVPNLPRAANPTRAFDDYARWIAESLVPAVRREVPHVDPNAPVGLDGCSLGGYVAFETFLRHPDAFGTIGGVQSAIGEGSAARYAERFAAAMARVGPRPFRLSSSSGDPFLPGNRALAAAAKGRRLDVDLHVLPGPHDQPWLREAGTLEMLLWHDRALRR
jgi:pimeloyl-ACP methyl ester carboxylesterase